VKEDEREVIQRWRAKGSAALKAIIDQKREEMNTMPNPQSFRIRREWRKHGMVSNAIESTKGRRSLVALLAALAVATIGVYLVAMSAAAKPAEAVSCAAFSHAPKVYQSFEMQGMGEIQCSGPVTKITVTAQLQRQNANGGWSIVKQTSGTTYGEPWAHTVPSAYCTDGANSRYAYYRTVTTGFTIAGPNDYRANYGPKYSSKQWLKCSGLA
jgi:hypothetical protein